MANVTYFVVIFDRNEEGELVPDLPIEMPTLGSAYRRAEKLAPSAAGVVAFSRLGDPAVGEFEDAVIIVTIGEVDLDALA